MARALRLASRGLLTTSPNPRVGCVVVRDGRVLGEGWHVRAGEGHAEVLALRAAVGSVVGATAYVTLEPCSHYGLTPPCAEALIEAGLMRVVVAMLDPNPLVAGSGVKRLRKAGMEVLVGIMQAEALALNPGFVSRMLYGRPLVRVKLGASLDGRTALANGLSQWITGPDAREDVQLWRARSCAVMTGVGTICADNARLTVRRPGVERQPLRVVLDTQLRTPSSAAILQTTGVLLIHGPLNEARGNKLSRPGVELWQAPVLDSRIDLMAVMQELARRGINEVLVEAGPTLAGALLKAGLVDELLLYEAALVLGSEARGLFDDLQLDRLEQASHWTLFDRRALGCDWRLRYTKNSN